MDSTLKTLRAELKLNATQMKGSGADVDSLKDRQKLLQSELSASREKTTLLNAKLQEAVRVYGANSTEARNLATAVTNAKNVEAAIQNELQQTNAQLENQRQANSELEQSVIRADSKIESLNKELELNATKMQGAGDKTDGLKERQKLLAEQSQASSDKVNSLESALETCGQEVGENSDEYAELKSRLVEAKTEQAAIQNEIQKTTTELKNQKTEAQLAGESLGKFGKTMEKAGQATKTLSAGAAAGIAGAGTAAVTFESAFAGVKKTVDEVYDANGKCTYSYQELENGIRSMAKEIPSSVTEISAVAEAAGQLGIKTEDILGFTRVMIDLGESTNLSSDVAATSIAKFANVTGLAADESMSAKEKYGRLGSVLVDLGNKYATTESDIMEMAQNLASAGSQVGMSESDIMALAASLSSVGLEAQAGGTAFSKAMIKMQLAVETNSDSLEDWAEVAGMSTEEFSRAFKEDATGALQAFIKGLAACGDGTDSAIKVLDDMGITETRMRDALLRSANASDIFTSAIQTGKDAWSENNALTEEAGKRYETTASQLGIMKNHLVDAGISLGSVFLPIINKGVKKVSEFAEKITGLGPGALTAIAGLLVMVAILSPLLSGIGKVSTGISALIGFGGKLAGAFTGAGAAGMAGGTTAAAGMALPLIPILAVVAGVGAIIGVLVLLWNKSEDFRSFFTGMWEGLKDVISGFIDKINFGDKIEGIKSKFVELGGKLTGLTNFFKVAATVIMAMVIPALGLLAGIFNGIISAIEPLLTIVGGIIDVFSGLGSIIVGVFTGDFELAKEGASTFLGGIGDIFSGGLDFVIGLFKGFGEGIAGFFGSLIEVTGIDGFIDNVKEKFKSIGDTVSGVFDTIGNVIQTGLMFIGELFSAAFQIITLPFQFIWENCKTYVIDAWDAISGKISEVLSVISSVISSAFGTISETASSIWNGIKSVISSIWDGISSKISSVAGSIWSGVKNTFNNIKTAIEGPIRTAKDVVSTVFDSIKTAISDKIEAAKNVVKNAIDKIKSFFNFSWSLPNLKLPHISITGSFSINPPSVPHFGIDWYKSGAIFNKATILDTRNGFKGVGEAGAEAVLPIDNMRTYIRDEMENVLGRLQIPALEIDYDRLADAMAKRRTVLEVGLREFGRLVEEVT